jgi:pantetheine-phosphate adenylyltransferase
LRGKIENLIRRKRGKTCFIYRELNQLMVKRFHLVATGGTFDEIHSGHLALLSKAFDLCETLIIGVTSDEFATKRKGKNNIHHRYEERVANLKDAIRENFGDVKYQISKLDNDYGPVILSADVDALVASTETAKKGNDINRIRHNNGLAPIEVVIVDLVKAYDGKPISSSRIRSGEIDAAGKKLKLL